MAARSKTWPLSIYLLKQGVTEPYEAVKGGPSLRRVSIGRGRGVIGTLYHQTTPVRSPRWVEFFGSHVDRREFRSSSVAAVLLVRAGGRFFALTFGHGRHLLDPASYEEGFGLRVTLNSVTPERIRTIDRKALDATGRHLTEQASRNIPIIEFGLDIDKDILCAVMGPPEDSRLGKRLAGADALSAVAEVELASLRDKLQAYLAQYLKEDYRERFPWVDNIREVRDPSLSDELDEELVKRISARELERVWLAAPELLDWRDVAGFAYARGQEPPYPDDISFESYLDHARNPGELSPEMLRHHRVFCISVETDSPREQWSLYRCIYAEIDRHGGTYLLNGGKWYQVSIDYLRAVNEAIGRMPSSDTICFPEYNDPSETDYNERMHHSDPAAFALMDRKTVRYGGGSSRIEFCDLYSYRKEMIHVKRYGGSSVLSHLFAQGAVSANIFLSDPQFRHEVNTMLPPSHQLASTEARPQAADFEVAYAIASKDRGPLLLPFFSRVTLRSAYQQLRSMGYRVTLTKIQCQ